MKKDKEKKLEIIKVEVWNGKKYESLTGYKYYIEGNNLVLKPTTLNHLKRDEGKN